MLTIVFPSKDKDATKFCIRNLVANSSYVSEIIVLWNGAETPYIDSDSPVVIRLLETRGMEVYSMFNLGAQLAENELVLFINDDMHFPSKWDAFIGEVDEIPTPLTFTVVEPGIVDVSPKNIEKDFGRTLESFDKEAFEEFAREPFTINRGLGWYMPVLFDKSTFRNYGMYPTNPPFPFPNDIVYFDYLMQNGVVFYKSSQKIYHFQRLSQRPNQALTTYTKLNLCCGNDKLENFLNCDISNSDFDFDLSNGVIPFQDETFTEVLFKHALEHFRAETGHTILREIRRIIAPSGCLHILVPDLEQACKDMLLGWNEHPNCVEAIYRIYGQNTNEELVHKWGYTADSLVNVLKHVGFKTVVAKEAKHKDELYMVAYV